MPNKDEIFGIHLADIKTM